MKIMNLMMKLNYQVKMKEKLMLKTQVGQVMKELGMIKIMESQIFL